MRRLLAFLMLLAPPAAAPSPAETFEDFGRIGAEGECFLFYPFQSCTEPFLTDLDSVPDSLMGSIVHVRGDLVFETRYCPPRPYPFRQNLDGAEILELARPVDLGCGVLVGDPEETGQPCLHWSSPVHGDFLVSYGGHEPGDTLGVMGIPDPCCLSICMDGAACLENWWYYSCAEPPPATQSGTWGAIKARFQKQVRR